MHPAKRARSCVIIENPGDGTRCLSVIKPAPTKGKTVSLIIDRVLTQPSVPS
jgi:hypothetical protein